MSDTMPFFSGGGKDLSSAANSHVDTVLIKVGAGEVVGASDDNVVGAVDTPTAEIGRDKKIPPFAVFDDERRFDSTFNRWGDMFAAARPGAEGIEGCVIRGEHAGLGIKLTHFDAAPETAPTEPDGIFIFVYQVGVNRVEVILAGGRADYHAVIDPFVVGAVRVKGGVGGESDGGVVAAEG